MADFWINLLEISKVFEGVPPNTPLFYCILSTKAAERSREIKWKKGIARHFPICNNSLEVLACNMGAHPTRLYTFFYYMKVVYKVVVLAAQKVKKVQYWVFETSLSFLVFMYVATL